MESCSILNYKELVSNCPDVRLSEENILKVSKILWEYCKKIAEDNYEYQASVFCLAINIAARCDEIEETVISLGSFILASTLISHPFDALSYNQEEETALEKVLALTKGYAYIPNVCMYYNLIETTYRCIDSEYYEFALRCACCISSSLTGLKLDSQYAAEGLLGLIRLISNPSEDSFNITSKTSVNGICVNTVYSCIIESPLCNTILEPQHQAQLEKYLPNINKLIEDIEGTSKRKKKSFKASLEIDRSSFYTVKQLGAGQYGVVTSIKTLDGKRLAHKEQKHIDPYIREIVFMTCFKHKNIVHIKGFNINDRSINTSVYPYTLEDLIKSKSLTKNLVRHFVKQFFSGLVYIHSCGIIHGDIKPNNVFITSKQTLKIADFGMAIGCATRERRTMISRYVSWPYRPYELFVTHSPSSINSSSSEDIHYSSSDEGAPEVTEYSFEIDIWSGGVLILQMYDKGFFASSEDQMKERIRGLLHDMGASLTMDIEEDIGMLIRQCFMPPCVRPNALQCLSLIN